MSRTSVLHARQSSDGSKKYQQSSARGAGAYLGCDAKYSMKHNFGIHLQFHFCREDETVAAAPREPSSCSAENDDYPGVRSWSFNLGEQKRTSHVISHQAAVEKKNKHRHSCVQICDADVVGDAAVSRPPCRAILSQ